MQLPNTFSEIDNLELLAKQLVEGFIIGLHKSPYHGFSVEFAEHRQYNHGDNLKHVDWKVYGRKDTMFTKKYEALIHLLKKQLDAFAIAQLDEQLSYLSKFGTTSSHYKQQIAHLQHLATSSHRLQKTNISQSLHELAERIHQRSLVVLFTDIPYQEIADQRFLDGILHLKHRKNEVLIFHLIDKRVEEQFELENTPHELVDLETGQSIKVHPNSIKTSYIAKIKSYKEHIQQFCLMHNIGLLSFGLEQSITIILQEYLQKRSKMM
jgi:hypothetical protein